VQDFISQQTSDWNSSASCKRQGEERSSKVRRFSAC